MNALKTLAIATVLLGSAVSAEADDNAVGLTSGETGNNIQKPNSLSRDSKRRNPGKATENTGAWGMRGGQSMQAGGYDAACGSLFATCNGNPLGGYLGFLPGGGSAGLSGGAKLGLVKLEHYGEGFGRGSAAGYSAGLQAGIPLGLDGSAPAEGGYRYPRGNASGETAPYAGSYLGSLNPRGGPPLYLGAHYSS